MPNRIRRGRTTHVLVCGQACAGERNGRRCGEARAFGRALPRCIRPRGFLCDLLPPACLTRIEGHRVEVGEICPRHEPTSQEANSGKLYWTRVAVVYRQCPLPERGARIRTIPVFPATS